MLLDGGGGLERKDESGPAVGLRVPDVVCAECENGSVPADSRVPPRDADGRVTESVLDPACVDDDRGLGIAEDRVDRLEDAAPLQRVEIEAFARGGRVEVGDAAELQLAAGALLAGLAVLFVILYRGTRDQEELSGRLLSLMNNIPGLVYRGLPDWSLAFVGSETERITGYTTDWTGRFSGAATAVVRPGSTGLSSGTARVHMSWA